MDMNYEFKISLTCTMTLSTISERHIEDDPEVFKP